MSDSSANSEANWNGASAAVTTEKTATAERRSDAPPAEVAPGDPFLPLGVPRLTYNRLPSQGRLVRRVGGALVATIAIVPGAVFGILAGLVLVPAWMILWLIGVGALSPALAGRGMGDSASVAVLAITGALVTGLAVSVILSLYTGYAFSRAAWRLTSTGTSNRAFQFWLPYRVIRAARIKRSRLRAHLRRHRVRWDAPPVLTTSRRDEIDRALSHAVSARTRLFDGVVGILCQTAGIFGLLVAFLPSEMPFHKLVAFLGGVALLRIGRKLLALDARTILARRKTRPVLFLRPFAADTAQGILVATRPRPAESQVAAVFKWMRAALAGSTVEEEIAYTLGSVGTFVSIGRPDELLRSLGSRRMYVAADSWQSTVELLVRESRLVVLQVGTTPGILWELQNVVRLISPTNLLLLLPYAGLPVEWRSVVWGRFVSLANQFLPMPLPADPGEALFVRFNEDWSPQLEAPSRLAPLLEVLTFGLVSRVRVALWAALYKCGAKFRRLTKMDRAFLFAAIVLWVVLVRTVLVSLSIPTSDQGPYPFFFPLSR